MSDLEYAKAHARAILDAALEVSASDKVPPEMKEIAFVKAVDAMLAVSTAPSSASKDADARAHTTPASVVRTESADSGSPLDKIAARLKVDRDTVAEVFDDADGKVDVIVPTSKFDSRKAPAAKQLALLIAGARQAAEIEEWTDLDAIRPIVADFKRYDTANFATTIKEMEDVFRVKQNGRTITVRLGRPGWDALGELVRKLGGEADR
jgi:hypothetical protein